MPEFNIKVDFKNETHVFLCAHDQDILSAARNYGLELPSSCCAGVCTSCASFVKDGELEQDQAMGLNDDLQRKGFALLCVAFPKSDLHLIVGDDVEDDLYNDQFGKYQK